MFIRRLAGLVCNPVTKKPFHTSSNKLKEYENPILRTLRILGEDFSRSNINNVNDLEKQRALMGLFPRHADIVIIGGGSIGSSVAYWLKEKTSREGMRVVVIEKDATYSKCSTNLSVGALHQQYSLPENIQMSVYGAEFLRSLKNRFGKQADVHYTPHGYLLLTSEEGAQQLIDNSILQRELGVHNKILSKEQISEKFPWLNVSGVELGCIGLEKEGWFDPWSLFLLMKYAAMDLGTQYIQGEVVDFTFKAREDIIVEGIEDGCYEGLNEIIVRLPDGEHRSIQFAYCIMAAGIETAELSQLARIGGGSGMLSIPTPIEKRKRFLYQFNCKNEPPGINSPLTVDYTGAYFRRTGLEGTFTAGFSPLPQEELELSEAEYFEKVVRPILSNRVPAFNDVNIQRCWSGYYDYNCFDDNGIIGPHPYYHNLYLATGFSGFGIHIAPAVGRAVAELILDGDFKTIDLTRLGFDRFIVDKPMFEYSFY